MKTLNGLEILGNTDGGSVIDPIEFDYDADIVLSADPIKDDYAFDGWYLDETFETEFTLTKMPAQNITLYALWSFEGEWFTVVFDTGEGSEIHSVEVIWGKRSQDPQTPYGMVMYS
ncbi:MAG: InlB B-repeat-containing protein [Christensenellales bacterium]